VLINKQKRQLLPLINKVQETFEDNETVVQQTRTCESATPGM